MKRIVLNLLLVLFAVGKLTAQNPFRVVVEFDGTQPPYYIAAGTISFTVNGTTQSVTYGYDYLTNFVDYNGTGDPNGYDMVFPFAENPGTLNISNVVNDWYCAGVPGACGDCCVNWQRSGSNTATPGTNSCKFLPSPEYPLSITMNMYYYAPVLTTPFPRDKPPGYFQSNPVICDDVLTLATFDHSIGDKYQWQVTDDLSGTWRQFAYTTDSTTSFGAQVVANAFGLTKQQILTSNKNYWVRVVPDIGANQNCFGAYDRTSLPVAVTFGSPVPSTILTSTTAPVCPTSNDASVSVTGLLNSNGTSFIITEPMNYSLVSTSGPIVTYQVSSSQLPIFNAGNSGPIGSGQWNIIIENQAKTCTSSSATITINPATPLQASGSVSQVIYCSGGSGEITVSALNEKPPYTYTVNNNNGTLRTASVSSTSHTFTGLPSGNYVVTVQGCSSPVNGGTVALNEPTSVVSIGNLLTDDISCSGVLNGSISGSITQGQPPYRIALNGSGYSALPGNTFQFTNLQNATHSISVLDAHDCVTSQNVTVGIDPPITLGNLVTHRVSCSAVSDGSLQGTISYGKSPYTISVNGGTPSVVTGSNFSLNNLAAGDYSISLSDIDGCSGSLSTTITQNSNIGGRILPGNMKEPSCDGLADGLLQITPKGGSDVTFEYSLNNSIYQSSNQFSGLEAGSQTITIRDKDAPACRWDSTFVMDDPPPPSEIVEARFEPSYQICTGQSFILDAGNGIAYQWSSPNGFNVTSREASITEEGNYSVEVTLSAGCTGTANFDVFYSTDVLVAEFLVPGTTYAGDTIVCVDLSNPDPTTLDWIVDESKAVIIDAYGPYIEMVFMEEGDYEINLQSTLGGCLDSKSKTISVLPKKEGNTGGRLGYQATGIREIGVSPNPSEGRFVCLVDLYEEHPVTLRLMDMNGHIVGYQDRRGDNSYSFEFDVNLAAGLYWLIAEADDNMKGVRILIR